MQIFHLNLAISFPIFLHLGVPSSAEIRPAILVNDKTDKRPEDVEEEGDKKGQGVEDIDYPDSGAAGWDVENCDKFPCHDGDSQRKIEHQEADGDCEGDGDGVLGVCNTVYNFHHLYQGVENQNKREPVGKNWLVDQKEDSIERVVSSSATSCHASKTGEIHYTNLGVRIDHQSGVKEGGDDEDDLAEDEEDHQQGWLFGTRSTIWKKEGLKDQHDEGPWS